MNALARSLPVLFIATLAACSGGSSSPTPISNRAQATSAPPTSAPSSKTAQATISIVVPLTGRTTSAKRTRNYVSPNTASFGVTLNSTNGTAVSNPPTQYVNVTPTSPGCSSNGIVLTCTSTVTLPVGTDVLSVDAWSGGNGSGAVLSSNQTVTTTIASTVANTIAFTMNPVAATISVSTAEVQGSLSTQPAPGSAYSENISVSAQDCTGATIVGPGSYVDPIALTLTEVPSLNATSLSETTVNSPSDVVTLKWTGNASTQYASIAPYVAPYEQGCNDGFNYLTTGYFLPRPTPPYMWTAQYSASGATGQYGWLVGYPVAWIDGAAGTSGMRPGVTIEAPGIGFFGLGLDHAGDIFTLNQPAANGTVGSTYEYAAGSQFDATPQYTIDTQPPGATAQYPVTIEGLASDPAGNLFDVFNSYINSSNATSPAAVEEFSSPYTAGAETYQDAGATSWPYNGVTGPGPIFVDSNDDVIIGFEPVGNPNSPGFIGVVHGGAISVVTPAGDPAIGGVWSDGTTVYAEIAINGTISVISYPLASILSNTATETVVFSAAANTVQGISQGPNSFARDSAGYYYLQYGGFVSIFAPTATGSNVSPTVRFTNAADPTTASGAMYVPTGLVAPGNGAQSIAVMP